MARLVLLAVADYANDAGREAYPAVATLAAKTGLSQRGVRGLVVELVALGELKVEYKAGPKGCNRYQVVMADPERRAESSDTRRDVHSAPRAGSTRHVVPGTRHATTVDPAPRAPEPSENHPPTEPSIEPSRAKRSRVRPDEPTRPDVEQICTHLADRIVANGSKRPTVTAKWRDAARLLLDKDGRTVDQVIKAIDWCQDNEFWRANVLSMPTLRAKYETLRLQATRNRGSPSNGLVERDGLKLKPETAQRLDDRARFEAMDAANRQTAIEGPPREPRRDA